MYSTGRRSYYELKLPNDILENRFDVKLEFDFDGLNLQVFSGNTLINDYFNTDRKFVMYLRDYKKYIEKIQHLLSALHRKQNSVFQTFIMRYRFL